MQSRPGATPLHRSSDRLDPLHILTPDAMVYGGCEARTLYRRATGKEISMIIDFHTHVLPPEDFDTFTGTGFHKNIGATKGKPPGPIENVLDAAKIAGVDISVISNPLHNLRDMDRAQQLER